MQKKLQLTTLSFLWIGFLDFLSGFHECLLHKKIKGKILTFLLFLFSVSGYSQLSTENFEGGIPATWKKFQTPGPTLLWDISNDGYLGGNAAYINPASVNIGAGNTAEYFLVTPSVTPIPNGEIRFFTKQGSATNNGTIYQLRLSTATQPDINGFTVVLKSWTEAELNSGSPTAYEEKVVPIPADLPSNLNFYVAFVAVNTQTGAAPSGDSWFVDNVRVVESCLKVTQPNFTVSNITANSANLSWTHPSATSFEVQVVPQGTAPAANGTVVANSYPAGSLAANTFYDVYIKTLCGGSVPTSEWAGPFPFKTSILGLSCSTPIVIPDVTTQPFTLSTNLNLYENAAVTYPNQGTGCLSPAVTGNYLAGAKAFLTYTPTANGLITITQTTLGGTGCYNNSTGVFVYDSCANVGVSCIAGVSTSAANVPKRIQNLFVQAGHTYVIVVSSNLLATASICFTLKVEGGNCAPPANYTYKDLLQNSVSFSWDNVGGFATAWEYKAVPTGSGAPAGAGTLTTTNLNNVINTGLAPGTSYDLYVRSVCNNIPGSWGLPYKFTTQCPVFSTPYSTQFTGASATVPTPCWTAVDVNGDGQTWSYLGGYATMQTSTYQNYNNDMFASPQVNLSGVPKRLRYKHQVVGGVSSYAIRISTTGIGAQNFTIELAPDTQITNTTWQEKIINIPTSITGPVNIAFVVSPATGHTATRISIDDVFIEDKPACPDPLSPTAQNITENQALLSWTNGDTETQWQVSVQPYGAGVPTGSGVLVNSNPYLATLLNPATHYEYYVRAYCSATQTSNWIGPFDFTTTCITFPTPFSESFNDTDPTTKKFCWSTNNANNDGAQWTIGTTEARIQRGFMGPSSFNDWLITPAINVSGNKKLSFKYRALATPFTINPRHGIEVLISTTDTNPSSFTVISPLMEFTNTVYQEKSLYFTANGPVYIAFRVPPELSSPATASTLNLDDVVIEDAPACPNPSNLTAADITEDSAVLSWVPGYAESAWEVKIQIAGTTNATVTPVSSSTYTPNTLLPNTIYEYYVRASCGSGVYSDWIGSFTFRTLCNPINAPFTETFNSNSQTEDCWRIVNNNNDSNKWNMNVTVNPYEGDQMAGMFTGSNGQNEDWLISPTINVAANQRLRYYYRVNDSFFTEDLKVRLSTNGIALDQFTTILYDSATDPVLINNMEYKEKIINLPAGITGNINIAFHVPFYQSTGPYRGQLLFIDNVVIEDIPACPQPSNLVAQNVTDTEAQISWDANGTTAPWEISVQPYGTPAPVGNTLPQYLHTAGTNPYTITNLTPALKYQYYVRALCSGSQQSEWVGPFEFTTKCSFENLCEYTIVLSSGNSFGVGGGINVMQNGMLVQTLEFPTGPFNTVPPPAEYTLLLCSGVEYSLFWDSIGTAPGQYPNAQVQVKDASGTVVWASPMGLGTPRTTLYTGLSICGPVTCPQPTNLQVNAQSEFSWTAGGTETQWEVFIQPVGNGTLPQSGTIVNTTSYVPQPADFNSQTATTFEYFVRAICSATNKSYWSGPKVFIRNDEPSTAIRIPVNPNEECNTSASDVTFNGATASATPMSCGGINGGDIWFEFDATSKVHIIEANGFTGNFYQSSGDEPYPNMTMTLYKVGTNGVLEEKACSNNNVIVAMYMSELVVGETYKVRLTLNSTVPSTRKFNVCVKTPVDLCDINAVNHGFEFPPMQTVTGVTTIGTQYVVPGWRVNLDTWSAIFFTEALNAINLGPYSGGQCIQILSDPEEDWNPNDPNIKGIYKEFDTSEITQMDYSFAHAARSSNGSSLQLFAGPPAGPFTLVLESASPGPIWHLNTGSYAVPAGQNVTRFIFRSKENIIGNLLDEANFKANVAIKTAAHTLNCSQNTTTVEAEGVGQWVAAANNPATTVIATPNNKTTAISGFTTPGVYTFYWRTRYCEKSIAITYEGISDAPVVTTPVVYCQNATATALTATPPANHTLLWYTDAVGGTGNPVAPVPVTTAVGNTSYYVSLTDTNGCVGPRTEIVVQVNALPVATITAPAPVCSGTTATVTFNGTPNAVITYTVDGGANQTVTLDTNGVATVTTPALTVNSVYTLVSVTETGTNACMQNLTASATVNVLALPTATISGSTTICFGDTAAITITGTPNATVIYTINGGAQQTVVLDATGTAVLNTAAITATTTFELVGATSAASSCTAAVTGSAVITVAALPTATISGTATICSGNTTTITFTGTPNAVVTYNVNGGANQTIVLDAAGNATIVTGNAGTYTIVNVTASGALACSQAVSDSVVITVTPLTAPNVTFSYATTCVNATVNPLPVLPAGFTTGGVFSSATVTVNAATGAIDLATATAGTHQVQYVVTTDQANCIGGDSYTATIVLTTGVNPVTAFTYDNAYCAGSPNAFPVTASGFTQGGTFSAGTGLTINSTTGEINIAGSTPGTYTITYLVQQDAATCNTGGSDIFTITISQSVAVAVESACESETLVLKAVPVNGSYNPDTVSYIWKDQNNITVGTNAETFNVDQYLAQNPTAGLPLNFSVTVLSGNCSGSAPFTVTNNPCKMIPKGISPNNDGANDAFDLTGLGVRELSIFNRYGTEVYSFKGNYTNQWNGVSGNGNELPDGTYFYAIHKENGTTVTGWVYINREH